MIEALCLALLGFLIIYFSPYLILDVVGAVLVFAAAYIALKRASGRF